MAKEFASLVFDPAKCRREIDEFGDLLRKKSELSEKDDVRPFFRSRLQLSAFIGSRVPDIGPATECAFEYPILGDFAADLVIGRKAGNNFCVIEFEDGRPGSIFKRLKGKSTSEWSPRFEHGFSQIVDWFAWLDDAKKTDRYRHDFGHGHVRFSALLVIGREAGMTDRERARLAWRTEKVRVDSHSVECVTFDRLHELLDRQLRLDANR